MFKSYPDVITDDECQTNENQNYSINWEEIARWTIEQGYLETNPCNPDEFGDKEPPIDWCGIAESLMRENISENCSSECNSEETNQSLNSRIRSVQHEADYCEEPVAGPSRNRSWPVRSNRSNRGTARRRRRSEQISAHPISMHQSYFDDGSSYEMSTLPSHDYSFMEEDFLHDSSAMYQSDILSFLATRSERVRPHSIAEGYHFSDRAYGRGEYEGPSRIFTSTPKRPQRSSRAETFEMPDGSLLFNVTFEECLTFGRRLRHISDVRDCTGRQIVSMDREINETPNGIKHRVDTARKWLDFN